MLQRGFVWLAILVIVSAAVWGPIPIRRTGTGDFRAYWSAAYLLSHSENFSDPDLLMAVEREHTFWKKDFVVSTWNPPWLLALLLPYAFVSFERAAWLWLLTNILVVFVGAVLTWRVTAVSPQSKRQSIYAPLFAMFFLPTIAALHMGQVNTLVFFGIALYLFFYEEKRPFFAGAALTLTLVKPHLVYITIPLILLDALHKRNWAIFWGIASCAFLLTSVVFAFRPSFIADYFNTVSSNPLLAWQTPTLGGIFAALFGWEWMKLMGVLILPIVITIWWRRRDQISMPVLVAVSLLVSVISAPFGWNYDVVVLLIPTIQVIVWIFERQFDWMKTAVLLLLLLTINYFNFQQRTQAMSEVYLFWVPLALAVIYVLAAGMRRPAKML
jgi:hypothetical protein